MAHEKMEKLPIKTYYTHDGVRGRIELSKLAAPLTVQVFLDGQEMVPESFNCFGHPNFSKEQTQIYMSKNFEYKKKTGSKEDLELLVMYRVSTLNASRASFDTVKGIYDSLVGIKELNTVLDNRRRYLKLHPNEILNSFVLFGCFLLDEFAQVWSIEESLRDKVVSKAKVELAEEFVQNNKEHCSFVVGATQIAIPKPNSVCPCCGKKLTIYDVEDDYCVYVDGKYYHEKCYKNYVKYTEILEFTKFLVGTIYNEDEYQYELLPNGYCNQICCEHIPWFLIHTIHGDVVIGKRKRVISIEWQDNFKPFDMNEIFASEDVTKWEKGGKRGIHAWSKEKAKEYLGKVYDVVSAKQ